MKKIGLLLAVFSLVAVPKLAMAVNSQTNEPAVSDGNFGLSQIGVDYVSTGTSVGDRTAVTRRFHTENDGTQIIIWGIHRSTTAAVVSSSNTFPVDLLQGSSMYSFGPITNSSGILNNPNVIAIANAGRNVLLKRVRAGNQIGTLSSGTLVRIWDSRGSTATANGPVNPGNAIPLFEETLSTGAVRDLDIWISSGITKMTAAGGSAGGTAGIISIDYDEFNTNNQDAR